MPLPRCRRNQGPRLRKPPRLLNHPCIRPKSQSIHASAISRVRSPWNLTVVMATAGSGTAFTSVSRRLLLPLDAHTCASGEGSYG